MKPALTALAAGALFALGLGISGMTQPAKVQGFLDVTGRWDPTLAFVMLGAVAVHFVLYRLVRRRCAPLFAERFDVPTRRDLTLRLAAGAALFGVGWGLSGQCPGPAITNLATGASTALVFVGAMALGMALHRRVDPAPEQAASPESASGA